MDEIWTLIILSLAMLVGCFLAGMIPLAVTFSEEKLKLVTVLGAGLLIGTALAVIIPEGINAMYSSPSVHVVDKDAGIAEDSLKAGDVSLIAGKESDAGLVPPDPGHQHHHHDIKDSHSIIGVCLVTGFIFMLLVDQLGGSHMHSGTDVERPTAVTTSNRKKITATVGLVVHAAADGIALGAAITLSENHITFIVFMAIMLHKAPAAFGLVSFLLHEGFDRPRIRKHLLAFAIAAPLLSVITYMCLSQQSKETLSELKMTGIAMLFSAGTFLYVATVHVLPEISAGQTRHTSPDGTVVIHEHKGFTKLELCTIVFGAIIPALLAIGHKH